MRSMKYSFYLLIFFTLYFSIPARAGVDLKNIDIGGALRVNYTYKDWGQSNKDKGGDFAFDTFRLNVKGEIGKMLLSAEYRFYPEYGFNTIHHGWIGYNFNKNWQGQIGVSQVPFGIQPYASHNFWFSGAYYVGLEDDYDMGIKTLYHNGPLSLTFAFYKNAELGDSTNAGRYSVDVLRDVNKNDTAYKKNYGANEETNQGNIRMAYKFTHSDTCSTEVGLSGEYGGIYNNTTNDIGDHWAGAVHLVGNYGRWNIQIEGIQYEYKPKNPAGADDSVMNVGAYSYMWGIPAKARLATFNIAYGLPVDIGPINKFTFYSDNTAIEPDKDSWDTTWQNVVGCMISAGPLYTYIDVISAENMPFMGGSMVNNLDRLQASNNRNTRVNINFGYYF